jgi:hypothetical protein
MSASTSPVPRIELWLEGLANLTVAGTSPVDAERVTLMAGMLARDGFPPGAFNTDSMHHVTLGQRFFPAYDDVRRALRAWCDANRAATTALPDPDQGLDAMDRSWVAFWHKRRGEIFGQDLSQHAAEAALEVVSSLVRDRSSRAWSAITGNGQAVATGYPTEASVAYVAKLLRPEPQGGQPRYEVVEAPVPFRDVTAKGDELIRIRGKAMERPAVVVSDRGDWA